MSEIATRTGAERYTIDVRASRLTIHAVATGFLSAMGHNPVIAARDVSGDIRFAPQTLDSAEVRVRISSASLSVQNDVSDKDRREMERTMREQVLEVAIHPEMVFEGSKATIEKVSEGRLRVEMEGDLTLHGVTRRQRVPAQVFVLGDTLRAQGEVEIRQTDFGITLVSVAGGALKIKDEVKCSFDLLTRKAT
jgi:polyisoprenoid-binding protein YceI